MVEKEKAVLGRTIERQEGEINGLEAGLLEAKKSYDDALSAAQDRSVANERLREKMESVQRALEATEQREGDLKRTMAQNEADAKAREASAEVLGEVAGRVLVVVMGAVDAIICIA